ncbi:integrase [Pseudogemmobacter bohemicus]|uniref:integrase n=1 Tax=Pseudogemmobacter bohemicus TaxID=2250708 RepID=UPI001E51FC0B|nr:integrase [Pseudogemmobacter bohemicus]
MTSDPLFASGRTAARLLDMKPVDLRAMVAAAHLPGPRRIGDLERFDIAGLSAVLWGDRIGTGRGYGMVKPAEKRFLWTPDGRRWFVRRKGKYQRIMAPPGTPGFDAEYWEIMRGRVTPRTTWAALIEEYRKSDLWAKLKLRTRQDYEKCFDYIVEKNGQKDMTLASARDATAAMNANAHRVRFGNYVVSTMSVLAEYARTELHWIKQNLFRGLRKREVPEERKAPYLPWTNAAVAAFRAGATDRERLIFELDLGSVQRPADWCRFDWLDYEGGRLRIVQGKTDKVLLLPVTPELAAVPDRARPADGGAGAILKAAGGSCMIYSGLAQIMRKARARLQAGGLRPSRAALSRGDGAGLGGLRRRRDNELQRP